MDTYTGMTNRSVTGGWYWVILQNGEVHSSGRNFDSEWEAYEALCKELTAVETHKGNQLKRQK